MMTKHFIEVTKSARYFTWGQPGDHIKNVWYVLHGYGQLAENFISKFASIVNDTVLVVAPEALHRYYTHGNSGKVGASWMTREERESDVQDYIKYLDKLCHQISASCKGANINILGFSQGAATAARWVGYGNVNAANIVFWGGLFPPDMNWDVTGYKWKIQQVTVLIGDEDEYYKAQEFRSYYEPFLKRFKKAQFISYKGKHTIYDNVLKELISNL
jgi:predicted esterase